jgi:3-phenylpropionate/cinnamic acid dioxygenase small subunit
MELSEQEHRQLERFIYREAQLADESRYDEWEKLLTDDMKYWVPAGGEDPDPNFDVSIINDRDAVQSGAKIENAAAYFEPRHGKSW